MKLRTHCCFDFRIGVAGCRCWAGAAASQPPKRRPALIPRTLVKASRLDECEQRG